MSAAVWKYVLLALALLYLLLPYDILPDLLGVFGRIDDLLVAIYLFYRYAKIVKREEERIAEQARAKAQSKYREGEKGNARGKHEAKDPYEVLDVSPDASDKELQEAYRRRVAEYHPDKVNHLGSELKELAHDKMIAIQQAFEELKRRRRM